jgi:hypothetical protein
MWLKINNCQGRGSWIVMAKFKMITEHFAVRKDENNVDHIQDEEWDSLTSAE